MLKKLSILLFGCVFLLSMHNVFSAMLTLDAAPGGAIDSAVNIEQGNSFTIEVLVNDVSDFAGFEFDLSFNSAVLAATTITSGDIFGLDTFLIDDTIGAGTLSFSEVSLALSGLDISSPTLIATINFEALAVGTAPLSLSNVLFSDSLGADITPVTLNNASISVSNTAISEPNILVLMLCGLMMIKQLTAWKKTKISY